MTFELGRCVGTHAAIAFLTESGVDPSTLLARHQAGDWGDIDPEDKGLNEMSVQNGSRILSVYQVRPDQAVWVLTEAGRHATTILLPQEY